jgi:hypothetical protein
MKKLTSTPPRSKSAAQSRRQRTPGAPAPHGAEGAGTEPSADEASDESGNQALQSVATAPNPNVGRDDVERVPPDRSREGSVEST